jgi:hypothetical protein
MSEMSDRDILIWSIIFIISGVLIFNLKPIIDFVFNKPLVIVKFFGVFIMLMGIVEILMLIVRRISK